MKHHIFCTVLRKRRNVGWVREMGSQEASVRIRQPFKHPVPMTLVIAMLIAAVGDLTMGSEFPERECCDSVYPIPAPPGPMPAGHGQEHGMDPPFPEHPAPMQSTPPTVTTESSGTYIAFSLSTSGSLSNNSSNKLSLKKMHMILR